MLYSQDAESRRGLSRDVMQFPKGSTIHHEGDPANYWYEVVSGIVRTCRFLADGHRHLTGFFYSADVFGVDGTRYREAAEAVTDVLLRRYSVHSLRAGDDDGCGIPDHILERALESARQSIFLFGHRTAANRLAAFLITVADRSGRANGLQLPMTRSDIADHLNLTLHTVSRTIGDLVRQGLIALDGPQNVRILDFEGLQIAAAEAGSDRGYDEQLQRPRWQDPTLCGRA